MSALINYFHCFNMHTSMQHARHGGGAYICPAVQHVVTIKLGSLTTEPSN